MHSNKEETLKQLIPIIEQIAIEKWTSCCALWDMIQNSKTEAKTLKKYSLKDIKQWAGKDWDM